VLWIALPSMATCTASCAFAPNIPVLFILVALLSIFLALFWTSWECMFSSQEHAGGLLRSMMHYCLGFTTGDVVGTWLGTSLVNVDFGVPSLRLRLPFLVAGTIVFACMALLGWIERSGKLDKGYAVPKKPQEELHGGERLLPASRTVFFFVFAVAGITLSFVPLMVAREMREWTSLSSRVIAIQPFVQWIVFLALGYWSGWVHKNWPLWVCGLVLIIGTALLCVPVTFSISHQIGAWCFQIGLCLVGATVALSFLMNLLYSMERPDRRARNAGLHEAIVGFGMTAGPALGGWGAREAGNRGEGALWVAAALAVIGLVITQLVWWLKCRRVSV
jgi:MFS family permease